MEKTNAQRFIKAYNTIDYALRTPYNFNQGISFSELIRKAVVLDSVVRKYEDILVDYGRLRNAIIHRSNEEYIIAEPHLDVVEDIERIALLISTPPKVLSTIKHSVINVESDETVKQVIKTIFQTGFSNLPVYEGDTLIGVANGQKIINHLGEIIANGGNIEKYIEKTKIKELVIHDDLLMPQFVIADKDITIEQALNLFYNNRKLRIIVITKNGTAKEMPIGVVTASDIIDMNNILDNY